MPKAASLAEDIKKEFSIESVVEPGETGVFDVFFNENLIFSKKQLSRFPKENEIFEIIKTKK